MLLRYTGTWTVNELDSSWAEQTLTNGSIIELDDKRWYFLLASYPLNWRLLKQSDFSTGGASIWDNIGWWTPNRVLYIDNNGDLAISNNFVYEDGELFSFEFETATNWYTASKKWGNGISLWWLPADGVLDIIEDWSDAVFNGLVDPTAFGASWLLVFNGYNNFVSGAQAAFIASSDGSLFGQSWPSMQFSATDDATYQNFLGLTPNWVQIWYTDNATFFSYLQITNTGIEFQMPVVWTGNTGFQVLDLWGTQRLELKDDGTLVINDWAYQLPNADGNAWDVLTTDGFGNVTFQAPSWWSSGYTWLVTNPEIILLPWDVALHSMTQFWYQINWEINYYGFAGTELEFPWATNLGASESNTYVWTLDSFWSINFYEWTPNVTSWLIGVDVPSYPSDEIFLAELSIRNSAGVYEPGQSSITNSVYQLRTASIEGQNQQKQEYTNAENDYVWLKKFDIWNITNAQYYAGKYVDGWRVRCIQNRSYSGTDKVNNGGNNDIFNNKLQAVREFENLFLVMNYDGSALRYKVYEYMRDWVNQSNMFQRSSWVIVNSNNLDAFDFCVTDEWEWVVSYNVGAAVTNVIPFRVNSGGNLTVNAWWTITTAAIAPYARVSKINTGKFAFMYRENNAGRDLQVETYTTDWLTITSDLTTQTAFNDPSPISDLQLIGLDDSDAGVIYNQNNGNMYVIDATGASIVVGGANNPFGTNINVSFVWNDDNLVAVWKWGITQISYDVLGVNIGTQTITSSTGPATLFNTGYTLNDSVIACNIQTTNGTGLGTDIAILYNTNDNKYKIAVCGINTSTEQLNVLSEGQEMQTDSSSDSVIPLWMARIYEDEVNGHTFGWLYANSNGENVIIGFNQQDKITQGATITDYYIINIDRDTWDVLVSNTPTIIDSPSWNSPYAGEEMLRCYRKWAFIHNSWLGIEPPRVFVAWSDWLGCESNYDNSNVPVAVAVSKSLGTIQVVDEYTYPTQILNMGNQNYSADNGLPDVFTKTRIADMSEALGTNETTLFLHGEWIAKKDKILVKKQWLWDSVLNWPTMVRIDANNDIETAYPLIDDEDYIELSYSPYGEREVLSYRQSGESLYLIGANLLWSQLNANDWRWVKNVKLDLSTDETINSFTAMPNGQSGRIYVSGGSLSVETVTSGGTGIFITDNGGTSTQNWLITIQPNTGQYIEYYVRDGKCYITNADALAKDKQFSFTAHKWGGSTTTTSIGNAEWQAFSIGDYVTFQTELPEDVEVGRDINLYIDRAIDEAYATNNGEVQWQVEWALVPTNGAEALDAPNHSWTLSTGDINIPNTAKWLLETDNLVIPSSNISEWDLLVAKVSRIAIDDGNDPTADPVAFTMHMEYQKKAF